MKTFLLKTNLLLLAFLLIGSSLMAQRTIWEAGDENDRNGAGFWADPNNWSNTLPGSEEGGRAIFKGGDVVVAGDVSPEALGLPGDYRLEMGDNKDANIAKLTVEDGGHVGALRISHSYVGIWAPAILIVEEGGSMEFGEHLKIGSNKNYHEDTQGRSGVESEVHLKGTITVHSEFGIDFYNDKEFSGGTLYMEGGTLILTNPTGWFHYGDDPDEEKAMAIGKNGKIEYENGLIQLAGNHKESLEAYKSIGRITGDFDVWTEIVSIQEVEDSTGNMVADTTFITKLSNEGPVEVSKDATLSGLTISDGTLEPAFGAENFDYTVELAAGTTTAPTVTATPADANATVVVTDAADVTAAEEAERTTTIEVTAEDGETQNIYSIVFDVLETGLNDLDIENRIYPNPASSHLYISNAAKINRIEIYNMAGSKVFSQNSITTESIDVSELNSGLYIISMFDVKSNNIVRKFVKK
ncbi:MAG: T9SS type A sorting domain-containing protein [Prolixibacteraceae bacterium]|nr:T9SS type A sorting domain-containing protein [Prolixibacteraceae bacterium]